MPTPRNPADEAQPADEPGGYPGTPRATPSPAAWPAPPLNAPLAGWPPQPGTQPEPASRTPYVPLTSPTGGPGGAVYGTPAQPEPPAAPAGQPGGASGTVYGRGASPGYGPTSTPAGAAYGSPTAPVPSPDPAHGAPAVWPPAPDPAYGPPAVWPPSPGATYGSPVTPPAPRSAPSGLWASGAGADALAAPANPWTTGAPPAATDLPTSGGFPERSTVALPPGQPSTPPYPPSSPPYAQPGPAYAQPGSPYAPLYPQPGLPSAPPYQQSGPPYPPGLGYPTTYQPVPAQQPAPYPGPTYPYGQPPGPGYPPGYGWPTPVPPRRRRRGPIIGSILVILVLAAAGAFAAKTLTSSTGSPSDSSVSPGAGGPVPQQTTHTGPQTIQDVLDAQSKALVAGDQKGFLAGVDPKATSAVSTYKLLFSNMHAMHVSSWVQRVDDSGDGVVTTKKSFTVEIDYCVLVTDCDGSEATLKISAQGHAGKILIESATLPKPTTFNQHPYPWESSHLQAVTGDRVVVAASGAEASQLSRVLPIAEHAAEVADGFAHWGKPSVYVVYLAGPSDKGKWFGGELKNTLGEALPLGPKDIEVMLVMPLAAEVQYAGPGTLNAVLQHEMTHVATLWGDNSDYGHDTLIEGIAEYAAYNGHTSWAQYRMEDTRAYLRSGKWSGKCYMTSEITSKSIITASGAYGIGYLTIKRLVSVYGQDKMLDFWGEVERDGKTVETASTDVFGKSWTTVNADCAHYIHGYLGV